VNWFTATPPPDDDRPGEHAGQAVAMTTPWGQAQPHVNDGRGGGAGGGGHDGRADVHPARQPKTLDPYLAGWRRQVVPALGHLAVACSVMAPSTGPAAILLLPEGRPIAVRQLDAATRTRRARDGSGVQTSSHRSTIPAGGPVVHDPAVRRFDCARSASLVVERVDECVQRAERRGSADRGGLTG
jgi:hypothetical protein